jgi:hypothetical protein
MVGPCSTRLPDSPLLRLSFGSNSAIPAPSRGSGYAPDWVACVRRRRRLELNQLFPGITRVSFLKTTSPKFTPGPRWTPWSVLAGDKVIPPSTCWCGVRDFSAQLTQRGALQPSKVLHCGKGGCPSIKLMRPDVRSSTEGHTSLAPGPACNGQFVSQPAPQSSCDWMFPVHGGAGSGLTKINRTPSEPCWGL